MVSAGNNPTHYPIRAVDRVCDILDALANAPGGTTLTAVAEVAGLPKSSAFRYLAALEGRHYVERDVAAGFYRLGLAFRPQNDAVVERLSALAAPVLAQLRDRFAESANLGVLDGSEIVHAAVAESPHMMRLAARVGERGKVHCTALGKALCAHLPDDRVLAILEVAGMPRFTAATIVDAGEYLAELAQTREQGFGVDEAENQDAGRCVAVAIPGIPIHAGLSLSAPADRLPRERLAAVASDLREAADSLARELNNA